MSVLLRKTWRDLLAARAMLAAALAVLAIGVGCFVGLASTWWTLHRARAAYEERCRLADFWILVERAPLSEVEAIGSIPGVAAVEPRLATLARVELAGVVEPLLAQVLSLPTGTAPINDIVLRRGGLPRSGRDDEIVVDDAFARARGLAPGDRLALVLQDRRHELTIVGTASSYEFAYLMPPGGLVPDPAGFAVVWAPRRFLEQATDMEGATSLLVGRLDREGRLRSEAVFDEIDRRLESFGVRDVVPRARQSSHQILVDELAQLRATALVLPAVFLGVAALVLTILMKRLSEQQRGPLGALKALGWSDGALMRHQLASGALVGVAGVLGGMLLGEALARGMIVVYRRYFEIPGLAHEPVPWALAAGAAAGLAFALLGAARGAGIVLRLSPASAMRPRPPLIGGAIPLERWNAAWSLLGWRWRLVLRLLWRHPLRTGSTILAAACASGLLLTTFIFVDAMDTLVRFQFEAVLASDLDVSLRDPVDERALDEVARLPGVLLAEPLLQVECDLRHGHHRKRTALTGVDRGALLTVPRTASGRPVPVPGAGVLLSRPLAEILHAGPGDELAMRPVEGEREWVVLPVAGVVDTFLGLGAYADRRWLARAIGEADSLDVVQLRVADRPGIRAALLAAAAERPLVQAVVDHARTRRLLVETLLEALRTSILVLVLLAGSIVLASILTGALVSLSERRREIATLLALGHAPATVSGLLLRESMALNLLGALLGLPLGWALAHWLVEAHAREAYRLPTAAAPWTFAAALALAGGFTLAAHALVRRRVARGRWFEAINVME